MNKSKLTILFLLCLPFLLSAQYAVLSSDGSTVVIEDYSESRLLVTTAKSATRKSRLELPTQLKNNESKSAGFARLRITANGNWIFWMEKQSIWKHRLENGEPKGEWQLVHDHPKVQGRLKGFELNGKGTFMTLYVEINRVHFSDDPQEHHWSCRTIVPVDISNSACFLSDPLLFSDSSQLDQVWIVDERHLIGHYRNEINHHRELILYSRKGANNWSIEKNDVFPDYTLGDRVANERQKPMILFNSWSDINGMAFAELEEIPRDKRGSTIPQPKWNFFDGKDLMISSNYPTIPNADRFLVKLSPNGQFVAGSSTKVDSMHQKTSWLYYPAVGDRYNSYWIGGSYHDSIQMNHQSYFQDVSISNGLVYQLSENGRKISIYWLDFLNDQLTLIHEIQKTP